MLNAPKKILSVVVVLMGILVGQQVLAQGKHNKVHQIDSKEKPAEKPPKVPTPAPRSSPRNKRV